MRQPRSVPTERATSVAALPTKVQSNVHGGVEGRVTRIQAAAGAVGHCRGRWGSMGGVDEWVGCQHGVPAQLGWRRAVQALLLLLRTDPCR